MLRNIVCLDRLRYVTADLTSNSSILLYGKLELPLNVAGAKKTISISVGNINQKSDFELCVTFSLKLKDATTYVDCRFEVA